MIARTTALARRRKIGEGAFDPSEGFLAPISENRAL
jgi:hypothetical protein